MFIQDIIFNLERYWKQGCAILTPYDTEVGEYYEPRNILKCLAQKEIAC